MWNTMNCQLRMSWESPVTVMSAPPITDHSQHFWIHNAIMNLSRFLNAINENFNVYKYFKTSDLSPKKKKKKSICMLKIIRR